HLRLDRPASVSGWRADVEVCTERTGDLVREETAERLAGDPTNDFGDERAGRDRVVADRHARFAPRRLPPQKRHGLLAVENVRERALSGPARNARAVREQMTDLDLRRSMPSAVSVLRVKDGARQKRRLSAISVASRPRTTSTPRCDINWSPR